MKDKLDCVPLQQKGCLSLLKLLLASKNDKRSVASTGAISSIFSAMMMHPKDEKVQEYGCAALGEICYISDPDRSIISQSGAIPMVLKAMKHHPQNANVYKQACALLGNLSAGNSMSCSSIYANDGIGLILKSMYFHFKDPSLQEKGCYALSIVCRKNKIIINTFKNAGGLYLVSEAMKEHTKNNKVQIQACNLLSNLAYDTECKRAIVHGEAKDRIMYALEYHLADPSVVKKCLAAFCHLSLQYNDDRQAVYLDNQSQLPSPMDNNQPSSTTESESRSSPSSALCSDMEMEACEAFVTTHLIRSVVTVIIQYPNDIEIQKYSFMFLRNISVTFKGINLLEQVNSVCNVLILTGENGVHPSCKKYIKETLKNMDVDPSLYH